MTGAQRRAAAHKKRRREEAKLAAENNKKSPLLKLPAEIKNTIWDMVLEPNNPEPRADAHNKYTSKPAPPIAETCKAIRQDTHAMYYGQSKFIRVFEQGGNHDEMLPDGPAKGLKEIPGSILSITRDFQIRLTLSTDDALFDDKKKMMVSHGHPAQIRLIVKGDEYVLHAHCAACDQSDSCKIKMGKILDRKSAQLERLILSKIKDRSLVRLPCTGIEDSIEGYGFYKPHY